MNNSPTLNRDFRLYSHLIVFLFRYYPTQKRYGTMIFAAKVLFFFEIVYRQILIFMNLTVEFCVPCATF